MRRKTSPMGILWRLIIALILALCLLPITSNSAAAQSLSDYFSVDYAVEFSKTQIEGSETFYVTVTVEATCKQDLPVSPSEARSTGRIIARHQTTGAEVTLNSSYTVTISPFPSQAGNTTQVSKTISLQFPSVSQSGTYSVVGELTEAEVKVGIFWLPVTNFVPSSFLPASHTMGSVTYVPGSGDGGGGGGRGGGGGDDEEEEEEMLLPPGTTDVSGFVSADGTFTGTVVAESVDGKCELTIDEGTRGLSREGDRLTEIAMTEMEDWLAPPENFDIIGLTYDLGPDGATFDPPITLTITYDESLMPEGVAEENLVMTMRDEATGEWVMLAGCTVDPEANTITAPVSHFTAFTILAYTSPATFVASELSVTPAEVNISEEVTITTLITNTGELAGSYKVTLSIDNAVMATREVTLEGGTSKEVTFTAAKDVAGTYAVTVDGLSGTFVVRGPTTFATSELSITPAEVDIGEEVTITTLITNTGKLAGSYKLTLSIDNAVVATREVTLEGGASEEVTFTAVKDVAGTCAVTVDGLSGTFMVRTPPKPINWWLPGGIITACIVLVVVIYLAVIRRRQGA